jgi:short-subunit dehydrogenase
MQLRGRTVLITGASSGIGEATAKAMAAKGAKLLLLARSEDKLKNVAGADSAQGGEATVYPVDVSDAQAVARVATAIRATAGTPDVLINNAGAGRWLPLIETSAEEARRITEVPYLASVYVTREFLPGMLKRGSGQVVTVTSPASFVVWPNACAYIAARHALRGFTEALRSELHGSGIGVTLVVLGKVASPYWAHNPGSEERIPKLVPLITRTLTAEEAATAIIKGIERNRRQVISPAILRVFLHPLLPDWAIGLVARYPGSR